MSQLTAYTQRPGTSTTTAAIGCGLFAAVIAAIGSWVPSLWGDEVASLLSAERSVSSLLAMAQHVDAVHTTYYLGLHCWIRVFGTSPFAVRLPSALAIGACVAGVVLLARRIGTLRLSVTAGVVCAVLPRMTYDGEEARSYAFSAAIAVWLTIVLLRAVGETGRARSRWLGYALLVALGCDVFLYTLLVVLAHGVAIALSRRERARSIRGWAAAAGVGTVLSSPLLLTAYAERGQIAYLTNDPQLTAAGILVAPWFGTDAIARVCWTLLAAGVVVLAIGARRRRRHHSAPDSTPDAGLARLAILLWWSLPSIVLIGTSPVLAGYTSRYLAMCAPAVAIVIAIAIEGVLGRWRPALAVALAGVVALSVPSWLGQRGPYSKNSSDLVQIGEQIRAAARAGDAIVFDESVGPSRRPRMAYRAYPQYFGAVSDPTLSVPFWRNTTWHDTTLSVAAAARASRFTGVRRVWLVEYRVGACVDEYGTAELSALGYAPVRIMQTHRSEIIEYELDATGTTPIMLAGLSVGCV